MYSTDSEDEVPSDRSTHPEYYPYCPDDEVRELIYGVRETRMLPNMHAIYFPGSTILVGEHSSKVTATRETVDSLFACSLPEVLRDKSFTSLNMPVDLCAFFLELEGLYLAALQRLPGVYRFYPEQPLRLPISHGSSPQSGQNSLNAAHPLCLALCTAYDISEAMQVHCASALTHPVVPTYDWTPAYDSFFLNFWHEEKLEDKGISVSFRPRWVLNPTTTMSKDLVCPVLIPDVVFSLKVPVSTSRLRLALQYHPAYAFLNADTTSANLDIPIFIAEYNKAHPMSELAGKEAHEDHLSSAIAAALPLYAVLGIALPISALFFDCSKVQPFIGTWNEHGKPCIRPIAFKYVHTLRPLDIWAEPLDTLHLRLIMSNVRG
ncbi:hypothetical protein BDZ89DRAFT_749035 [Hymenopellis radicata]|nr:hypothetical protein BDZ89DRAFT_749035 [Hymenopellis radicata]